MVGLEDMMSSLHTFHRGLFWASPALVPQTTRPIMSCSMSSGSASPKRSPGFQTQSGLRGNFSSLKQVVLQKLTLSTPQDDYALWQIEKTNKQKKTPTHTTKPTRLGTSKNVKSDNNVHFPLSSQDKTILMRRGLLSWHLWLVREQEPHQGVFVNQAGYKMQVKIPQIPFVKCCLHSRVFFSSCSSSDMRQTGHDPGLKM